MKHTHISLLDVFGEDDERAPAPASITEASVKETGPSVVVESEIQRTQSAINHRFGMRTIEASFPFLVLNLE